MSLRRLSFFCVALLIQATPPALAGQVSAATAELSGAVQDQTAAVLPGATVTAINTETAETRTGTTGANGRFVLLALPVGRYRVEASLPGFATQVRDAIALTVGAAVDLGFVMTISLTPQTVYVVGGPPAIDVRRVEISTTVSTPQIERLPINGRNFISFAALAAGVTTDVTRDQGSNASSGLTFAGHRARSNNITLDGLDNNEVAVGGVRATISQEAVREFQVLTHSYPAEFGKASGGVVNIVTKSGTNQPHGSGFVFVRDEALNAKGYFERAQKAPFGQQQFGSTFGGPLRKNRSFYFVSVERQSTDDSRTVTIDDATSIAHPLAPIALGTPADILRAARFDFETGPVPFRVRNTQLFGRLDQVFIRDQRLTLRGNAAREINENIEPFGGITAKSGAGALDSKDWMLAAMHGAVLSPHAFNDLRLQLANRNQVVRSLDPACGGPCDDETLGGPQATILGVASIGRQEYTPQTRRSLRWQLLDTVSYQRGSHHVKTGFDFSSVDFSDTSFPYFFGGQYIFADFPAPIAQLFGLPGAVSAVQAFALGLPAAYIQGYGESSTVGGVKDLSLFAQDDWAIGDRLSLKAGLRYQVQFPPHYTYSIAGYPGPYRYRRDWNDVAPRLAVAWDPAGQGRTGVHAAYGVFYDNTLSAIPGVPGIVDGDKGVRVYVLQGLPAIMGWASPTRRLPEQALAGLPSLEIATDPGMVTPYSHHLSAGVTQQILPGISLSVDLAFANGKHQIGLLDYNPIVPELGPGRRPADVKGLAGTSASVLQYTPFADSTYRGLLVSVEKRFNGRSQFLVTYTLAKAEDAGSDYVERPSENGGGRDPNDLDGVPIGFDPRADFGPSVQDQRHRFVLSGLLTLPGQIQVAAIISAGSGRPYNVLAGFDLNGDGDAGAGDRARSNPGDPRSAIGRNTGRLPAAATVDARLSRPFRLSSSVRLEAIVEVFNLLNRTNFSDIHSVFGAGAYPANPLPSFGQFTQAGPPRQVQVAGRIVF